MGARRILSILSQESHKEAYTTEYIDYLLPKFLAYYVDTKFHNSVAFPGIEELLAYIENSNIAWGIVTTNLEY